MPKQPAVYILASQYNGTLYIGVSSNLPQRLYQHREGLVEGFSKKYGIKMLVYFEMFEDRDEAIKREKQFKKWHRKWKLELIESKNPFWKDLYKQIA